jgi:hypothetical protein
MPPAPFPSHYPSPFNAIATLLAGSLERASRGAGSNAHVDVQLPVTQQAQDRGPAGDTDAQQHAQPPTAGPCPPQAPLLLVEDDGSGLSPQHLRRMCGVPLRANTARGSLPAPHDGAAGCEGGTPRSGGGASWPDFVHAALRLGSTALVLTRRRGQGGSVALLVCTGGAHSDVAVAAAVVDFAADGERQLAPAGKHAAAARGPAEAAAAAEAWQAALEMVEGGWPEGGSQASLRQQLAAMGDQGTRVLIAHLRTTGGAQGDSPRAAQGHELDWRVDPADIVAAPQAELATADSLGPEGAPSTQGKGSAHRGVSPAWAHAACGLLP